MKRGVIEMARLRALTMMMLMALCGAAWAVQPSQVGRLERAAVSLGQAGTALCDLFYTMSLPEGEAKVEFRFGVGRVAKEAVVLLPADGRAVVVSKSLREADPTGCLFMLRGSGGEVPLRVSMPLRGIDWRPQYRLLLSPDEKVVLSFDSLLRVANEAGLDLPEGTLFLPDGSSVVLPLKAGEVRLFSLGGWEGLSVERRYVLDLQKTGENPILRLEFPSPSKAPLLAGTARVYIRAEEGERLLCSTNLPFTPPGGKVELECGIARDIVGKRFLVSFKEDEVWHEGMFCWATTREAYRVEVENHKKEAVVIEVVERPPDVWRLVRSNVKPKEFDARTLKFEFTVPAGGKSSLEFEVERTIIGPKRPAPFGPFQGRAKEFEVEKTIIGPRRLPPFGPFQELVK